MQKYYVLAVISLRNVHGWASAGIRLSMVLSDGNMIVTTFHYI